MPDPSSKPWDEQVIEGLLRIDTLVSLALKLGGTLAPVGTAVVSGIKKLQAQGGSQPYEVVLTIGAANLDRVNNNALETLRIVNEERVAVGLPPLAVPEIPSDGG